MRANKVLPPVKLISLWSYSEKHLLSPHLLFRAIFVGSLSCMKVSHLSQELLVQIGARY